MNRTSLRSKAGPRLPSARPKLVRLLVSLAVVIAIGLSAAFGLLPDAGNGAANARESAAARDSSSARKQGVQIADVALIELPAQAARTLKLIRMGGPFPYSRDGIEFGNRERLLPRRSRGYYTEYTVPTPGARNRGARRIIVGGDPASGNEYYYTDDHYESFRRIRTGDE